MIRLMTCVRKMEDIPCQDFRQYWESPAFSEVKGKAVAVLRPLRHARHLSLLARANISRGMESRGAMNPMTASPE